MSRHIINQNLSRLLDIEPMEIPTSSSSELVPIENDVSTNEADINSDVIQDSEFARQNIKNLISKGNLAIDGLLDIAKISEHPRAYEVASTFIKTLADMNKDLLEIQKRKKDLSVSSNDKEPSSKQINVEKAVFVGSTKDLSEYLKNKQLKGE